MRFEYSDGGRSKYYKAQDVGDCAIRAIANATGKDYKEVYDALKAINKGKSCRDGTPKNVDKKYLQQLGWQWHATMGIGTGCTTHLREDELPGGTLVVNVSKHLTCVKDGVIYDTFDCSRGGERCVYGYWTPPTKAKKKAEGKAKEYSVHIVNASGDEYFIGHYRSKEDAEKGAKKFHDNPRMKKVYIVEREVTEWKKSR